MKSIRIRRAEIIRGQTLPPWYYGHAFTKWSPVMNDVFIYYPIPINLFIRWGITIRIVWDVIRRKEGFMDGRILARQNTACAKAYKRGVIEGHRKGVADAVALLSKKGRNRWRVRAKGALC